MKQLKLFIFIPCILGMFQCAEPSIERAVAEPFDVTNYRNDLRGSMEQIGDRMRAQQVHLIQKAEIQEISKDLYRELYPEINYEESVRSFEPYNPFKTIERGRDEYPELDLSHLNASQDVQEIIIALATETSVLEYEELMPYLDNKIETLVAMSQTDDVVFALELAVSLQATADFIKDNQDLALLGSENGRVENCAVYTAGLTILGFVGGVAIGCAIGGPVGCVAGGYNGAKAAGLLGGILLGGAGFITGYVTCLYVPIDNSGELSSFNYVPSGLNVDFGNDRLLLTNFGG